MKKIIQNKCLTLTDQRKNPDKIILIVEKNDKHSTITQNGQNYDLLS